MRSPPQHVQLLLPVWGEPHTTIFLKLGLPSLMAPGNVPAVGRLGGCSFVLLAPENDAARIEHHPLWGQLQRHCEVSVVYIDDLISHSSSTVLTLAYALAIRNSGSLALDTCYVPLVADYILSDGSLHSAVKRVFDGASAVLTGNFQIDLDAALPRLANLKGSEGTLSVSARDFIALSFATLHSATRGCIVEEMDFLSARTGCSGVRTSTALLVASISCT